MIASSERLMYVAFAHKPTESDRKVKAECFEVGVQRLIDETPAAPPRHLRELVRRQLRRNGMVVTDIDAMAVMGGIGILINCKSRPLAWGDMTGDSKAYRNTDSFVQDAAQEWQQRVDVLRQHRRGDNYDLSSLSDLIAVVCTGTAMFSSLKTRSSTNLAGFFNVMDVQEIQRALGQTSA